MKEGFPCRLCAVSFAYLAESVAGTECRSQGKLHWGCPNGMARAKVGMGWEVLGHSRLGGGCPGRIVGVKTVQARESQGALCRGWPAKMAGAKASIDKEVIWQDG